ncbi:type II toxin-antitoxin system Phd/YefM family antitoxin [Planktothrix paucivesiculata]|jgi:antitoxin YefM|uniref:Antitoxin n=1 Tax=Planktothrix paucivesiculata PCC 9631 TaxID=671071 RepID=A0A7Z9DWF6_9CYAN|nr:type II toxin-antitoxin system Phd/YefM family antitoxin [Planktothrix paucivesiculata]VXD14757.1 Prevent-host-death protein [Planktothrix paucivesiculata PCC 9631]
MTEIDYAQACKDFETIYNQVLLNRQPITIYREGLESVSVIATAELESLIETVYLFQSHENAARLLAALGRAKAGVNQPQTVEKLRQEFGLGEEEKASA